jgi:hypothetical protein
LFWRKSKGHCFCYSRKGIAGRNQRKANRTWKTIKFPDAILHYLKLTLLAAIENGKWSIKKVARLLDVFQLGISRQQLQRELKKAETILTMKAGRPKKTIDENLCQRMIEFAAVNDDEDSLVEDYRMAFGLKALAKLSFWQECFSK